jgi:hypothetical protein
MLPFKRVRSLRKLFFFIEGLLLILFVAYGYATTNLLSDTNPSFEYAGDTNTGALHWTALGNADVNMQCYYIDGTSNTAGWIGENETTTDMNRCSLGSSANCTSTAFAGNYYMNGKIRAPTSTRYYGRMVSDYYIGTLLTDTNFCFDVNAGGVAPYYSATNRRFGLYNPLTKTFCAIGTQDNAGTRLPTYGAWVTGCSTLGKGTYNQYVGFMISREPLDPDVVIFLDNFRIFGIGYQIDNFTATTTQVNTPFVFQAKVFDWAADAYSTTITDINVSMADGNHLMTYNAGTGYYEYTKTFSNFGVYSYLVRMKKDTNFYTTATATVSITQNTNFLTCISNCTKNSESIDGLSAISQITLLTAPDDIIFSIDSNFGEVPHFNVSFINSLDDNRQYFAYSANPTQYAAGEWVFRSDLTYGQSVIYDDPIQKIWNGTDYNYTFTDYAATEKKYFKLVYRLPMINWDNLKDTWVNQLNPVIQDCNSIVCHIFTLTPNINNINNYYYQKIPDLSSTANHSYEFQFTAWAAGAMTLIIGDGNGVNKNVSITTTPHRYSVDISGNFGDGYLYMKTNVATSNRLFIEDPALMERGYFKTRMTLLQENYELLPVWINPDTNTSYNYIDEGTAFRFQTTAYDRDGKLVYERVKAYAYSVSDINKVMDETIALDTNGAIENNLTLGESINPIYVIRDANLSTGVLHRTTPILVTVDLCGVESGAIVCYEETSASLQLHNYPFFENDAIIQTQEFARKPNTPPNGKIILRGRVPSAFEKLTMTIYKGAFICNKNSAQWDKTNCNSTNTATDANLMFTYDFINGIDFICSGDGICDFEYNLENYFHYPAEDEYTTFTTIYFNTTDANNWYSRTKYTIGKTLLSVGLEFQGLDPQQYVDANCLNNVAGLTAWQIIQFNTLTDLVGAIQIGGIGWSPKTDPILNLIFNGRLNAFDYATLHDCAVANDGHIQDCDVLRNYIGTSWCQPKIPPNQSVKIVAHVGTTTLSDLSDYLVGTFHLTSSTSTLQISPDFYPTDIFYNPAMGENDLVFNQLLYDLNGRVFADGDYNIVMIVQDRSLQNQTNTQQMTLTIDATSAPLVPQTVDYVPLNFSATTLKGNILNLRSFIATRQKYIDKIDFQFYTDDSSFKVGKSDKENQIIQMTLSAEDIIRLEELQKFDASSAWQRFATDYYGADYFGACSAGAIAGGLTGVAATTLMIGTGLLVTGVGAPIGAIVAGVALIGGAAAMAGCGAGTAAVWGTGEIINTDINADRVKYIADQNYTRVRQLDIQLKNLQINDYQDLLAYGHYDANAVSPTGIINQLASDGKSSPLSNITINISGKEQTFENVLVGEGTTVGDFKKIPIKMRAIVYYNYATANTMQFITIDTVTAKQNQSAGDWLNTITGWIKIAFQSYFLIIIAIAFLLIAFGFARMIIFPPAKG